MLMIIWMDFGDLVGESDNNFMESDGYVKDIARS